MIEEFQDPTVLLHNLRSAAQRANSPEEARRITNQIKALTRRFKDRAVDKKPLTVLSHAQEVEGERFREVPHLRYLSDRLTQAMHDVQEGRNRLLTVSMPPRAGKSVTSSLHFPTMILRENPDWKIGMISHDQTLVGGWAKEIRSTIEENPDLGINLANDHGSISDWSTLQKGSFTARSLGGSVTGKGFKVLILDDLVKDFASAHSETLRNSTWKKWTADLFTRLEGPYLVIAIGTRWHEDDFIGRLLSTEYEGDPRDWEEITFPAIAEENDVLGREPGQPLFVPTLVETEEEALERWAEVRRSVGEYAWAALYQQHPSPAEGAIFSSDWWKFWTTNPKHVSENDDKVVLWNPHDSPGMWTDSWDMAFKGKATSDYVVGQRWCKEGATRYLVNQSRERMTFSKSIKRMKEWADLESDQPGTGKVHERLVEDKANGTAAIDVLKDSITGLIPINPTDSKEGRARSITPEIEAGNVRLPYPGDPGNEWVSELISEARNFPNGSNDDQVDAMSQYLNRVRDKGTASVFVPGRSSHRITRDSGQRHRGVGILRGPGR